MRSLDGPMHFYPNPNATRFDTCKNGCIYATVEDTDTCKYCTDKPKKAKKARSKAT